VFILIQLGVQFELFLVLLDLDERPEDFLHALFNGYPSRDASPLLAEVLFYELVLPPVSWILLLWLDGVRVLLVRFILGALLEREESRLAGDLAR